MADQGELLLEVKHLVEEVYQDRRKAKEKEAAEAWTKGAAVSLVIVAVFAATAVQKSGSYAARSMKYTNQSTFHQVSASDQWSFYQAKSTKGYIFELGSELVEHLGPSGPEEEKMIAGFQQKVKRYEKENETIMVDARKSEQARDTARKLAEDAGSIGAKLTTTVLGFQASITIGSIGLLTKRKWLWFTSLGIGLLSTVWMLYILFVQAAGI